MATVLAQAFSADAVTLGVLAKPADPELLLCALFGSVIRRHYLPHGAVDVAEVDGRIVGAAVWGAPGRVDLSLATMAGVVRDTIRVAGWRLAALAVYQVGVDRVHPRDRHWYLYAVGVNRPGHGVGGRLLDHGIARAADVPIYLEASTPDSARLYARKGFRQIGTTPTPRGLPRQPQMWRDPASL